MANAFFYIVVSTCQRQDRYNKLWCTYELKRDDKDDKLTNGRQSDSNKITLNVK